MSNVASLMKILKPSISLVSESSGADCNTYQLFRMIRMPSGRDGCCLLCKYDSDRDQGLDVQWDIYIDRNKVQKETKYTSSKHTVEQSGKGECLDCEKMH